MTVTMVVAAMVGLRDHVDCSNHCRAFLLVLPIFASM